ncbi:hypothetical protein SAMD00019534_032200 [Acytostelium subglobosum LB1]|uniref:hypothetical protein n=1 Tax=Acytostelium subglobosum LB1 TaxID=1410327 RepID=UPI000644C18E|nr:hypothetical protein SAMD00019534_032200 [Acytostelium subglobosum LB1]GAM20045.1 hypothetical protein SAMD00019534_032200 [Acytostelium subglobosum LB1]|eukprot:XP_012756807.1 hypothetical protein SAMD00019534_032200 [Acytostelium subglobosum LB1]
MITFGCFTKRLTRSILDNNTTTSLWRGLSPGSSCYMYTSTSTTKSSSGKQVISTTQAPAALGAYSQAIKANGQIFVSGCLGLDPITMKYPSDTDVELQAQQALENMKYVLEAGGSSMSKVVKTTILLKDINDFAKVNNVYSKYFTVDPPARSTFAVRDLPKNGLVEIEAIALE